MCDVSMTYLFRMHGKCAAHDVLPWRTCCGADGAFLAFPNTSYVRKPIRKCDRIFNEKQ